MTNEELGEKATAWIRSQDWSEENLPSDEYGQMHDAYIAGAKENEPKWHYPSKGEFPEEKPDDAYGVEIVPEYQQEGEHQILMEEHKYLKVYALYASEDTPVILCFNYELQQFEDFIDKYLVNQDEVIAWQYLPEPPKETEEDA